MAKIFLNTGDNFKISSTSSIFGDIGGESIILEVGATNVIADQNIDRVDFAGKSNDFSFQQTGNQIKVYDKEGEFIINIPLQGDENGTQLVFSDGAVSTTLSAGIMKFGGTTVTNKATKLTPQIIDTKNISQSTSGSGDNNNNNPNTSIDPTQYSYTNSGMGELSNINSEGVRSLDSGSDWESNISTLTYSFNENIPSDYIGDDELTTGFTPLNQEQREVVRSITKEIDQLLNVQFQEVESGGDIRFNIVDMEENTAGFSFYPNNSALGGDVFLSSAYNYSTPPYDLNIEQGRAGWSVIVHELGHSLGLKHPFEEEVQLLTSQDNSAHTIMSYTDINNYHINFTYSNNSIYAHNIGSSPQLYSLYDVSALQDTYGVNQSTNTGNNTYTMNFNDFKFQTIWDAGGEDTFDFSENRGDTTLNLQGGTLNSIDEYSVNKVIEYYQNDVNNSDYNSWIEGRVNDLDNENKLYTGKDNLGIANGVIIENVKTGLGNDTIIDNEVNNKIYTSAGDDKIYVGNGGYDYVDGGEGSRDTLYINLSKEEVTVEIYHENFIMYSNNYGVEFENIEFIEFNNGIAYDIDTLIA